MEPGRSYSIVPVRVLWLRHYEVLSFPHGEPSASEEAELISIALANARAQAERITGSAEKFTLIYSGHSTRRRQGWHAHIIVIRNRWQKAWLYFVLAAKNLLQQLNLYRSVSPMVVGRDS